MFVAFAPRHLFDGHTAGGAVRPSYPVNEEDRDAPQWHELESARRKPIVLRPLLASARADRPAIGPRLDIDLKFRLDRAIYKADLLVDDPLVPLDVVENAREMHSAVAPAK